jgi:DNA-binding LytR/AlgR family response regulator
MKCIIIDDEKFSREILSVMILKSPDLVLVGEFENAIDAIKYLNEDHPVDLIFLDIHMPNFSGFDFVKTLKNPPQIILVTTDKSLAIDAFNYDCIIDYLLKPFSSERFDKSIEKAKLNQNTNLKSRLTNQSISKEIYVNIDKRLVKIDVAEIQYIRANGDYAIIKTDSVKYTVHTTLKKIEEKLPKPQFIKVHRSHVINAKKIVDIKDCTVLIGKDIIPVSKNYRADLFESINLI